jgi:hypothetical protein
MIFRLAEKLNAKIKRGTLATLPLDENPFADWSAGVFLVGRSQYVLVTNTKSLYATVLPGKGITDEKTFVERALSSLREFMDADGQEGVYERLVFPVSGSVQFAKTLNRSVTGSMSDMAKHAAYWLAAGDVSPIEIASRLKGIPMSALKRGRSTHGFPRDAFKAMVDRAGSWRPENDRWSNHSSTLVSSCWKTRANRKAVIGWRPKSWK